MIKVLLKKDCIKRKVRIGQKIITAVSANDVERIILEHDNENISPRLFSLQPKTHSFMAKIPLPESVQYGGVTKTHPVNMTGTQLPIISSNATTGHKLQGATVTSLLVHTLTNVRNWTYVVLSRVREMNGLYLRRSLDMKNLKNYNDIPEELSTMIKFLRQRQPTQITPEEYKDIIFGSN